MRNYKTILALILIICLSLFSLSAASADNSALEAKAGVSAAVASEKYTKTISKGSNGDIVKAIQAKLIALGYLNDVADGSFGNKTKAAVETFEQEQGLTVDGSLEPLEIYYLLDGYPMTKDEVIISKATADNPASLKAALAVLPVRVTSAKVLVQSKLNKKDYPDMLTAVVQNASGKEITNYTVGFVAFDANGKPIKILTQYDENAYYEILGDAADISLPSGQSFGSSYGWRLDDNHGIVYLQACIEVATYADGETWENPIYSIWKEAYCEKTQNTANLG
ncbi:MAG: peptidoglycan-binding protein [Clostridia bacterium]|nr:peptidoglycan-binding protein [Clostridia bacterium]